MLRKLNPTSRIVCLQNRFVAELGLTFAKLSSFDRRIKDSFLSYRNFATLSGLYEKHSVDTAPNQGWDKGHTSER